MQKVRPVARSATCLGCDLTHERRSLVIETGVVIDLQGNPLHWHTPPRRTSVALPDSRELWDVFWTNRQNLLGFAHTHPGRGLLGPSQEDLTTFAAVEAGLGLRLSWWIGNEDTIVLLRWTGEFYGSSFVQLREVPWMIQLRALSFP